MVAYVHARVRVAQGQGSETMTGCGRLVQGCDKSTVVSGLMEFVMEDLYDGISSVMVHLRLLWYSPRNDLEIE